MEEKAIGETSPRPFTKVTKIMKITKLLSPFRDLSDLGDLRAGGVAAKPPEATAS
jgi:hypothetical protein